MGWYSFFITFASFSSNDVYAVVNVDSNLHAVSDQFPNQPSDISFGTEISDTGSQPSTGQTNGNEVQYGEENVSKDSNQNEEKTTIEEIEKPDVLVRKKRANISNHPSTVYSGPNNGWYITRYFYEKSLAPTVGPDVVTQAMWIANNIDMIVQQASKSFEAVNTNLSRINNELEDLKRRPSGSSGGGGGTHTTNVVKEYVTLPGVDHSGDINNLYRVHNNMVDFVNGLSSDFVNYQNYANNERSKLFGNFDIAINRANQAYSKADKAVSDALDAYNIAAAAKRANEWQERNIKRAESTAESALKYSSRNTSNIVKLQEKVKLGETAYNKSVDNYSKIIDLMTDNSKINRTLIDMKPSIDLGREGFLKSSKNTSAISKLDDEIKRVKRNTTDVIADAGIIAAIVGLHNTWKSNDYGSGYQVTDGDAVKLIKGQTNKLSDFLLSIKESIDNGFKGLQSDLTKNVGKVNNISFQLGDFKALLTMIKNGINDLGSKGFKFSDLGIITAVATVKDSVDKFKEFFKELFSVGDIDGLMAHEGSFVRMLKRQFLRGEETFKTTMTYLFGFDSNSVPTGTFSKYLENTLYKLRYSVVQGFEEFKDFLTEVLGNILGSQNTSNDYLKMLLDKEFINLKPVSSPEGKNWLGEVIKQAISTVGSILTEAIKGSFSLLQTALETLGTLLQKVIDFLDSLLDKVIALIVPKNLDFMNAKFDGTQAQFKLKFNFVFNWIDTFKGLLSNQKELEDIPINLGGMFEGSVNLPMSKISEFAPIVKAVITGFILLEFLIDMYKWFHRKGEVVE